MKQLILCLAFLCIITPVVAQDFIIGSEEFYDLYSWNANASFSPWEFSPAIYLYDLDQDGEDDLSIYISFQLTGNYTKYSRSIKGIGNFTILEITDYQYVKNGANSSGPGFRFNSEVFSSSAAEPFYMGDTVFHNSNFSSSYLLLSKYYEMIMEPPQFIIYYIDLFQKNPVYITAKKTVGSEEFLYFIKVEIPAQSSTVRFRQIYTNDVLFSDIEEQLLSEKTTLYPNPAKSTISIPQATSHISIFSSNGTLIAFEDVKDQNDYDVSDLQPGSYIIQIIIQGQTYSQKLIKQ